MKQQGMFAMLLGSVFVWPLQAHTALYGGWGLAAGQVGDEWRDAGDATQDMAVATLQWRVDGMTKRRRWYETHAAMELPVEDARGGAAHRFSDERASLADLRWHAVSPTPTPRIGAARHRAGRRPSLVLEVLQLDQGPTYPDLYAPGQGQGQTHLHAHRMVGPLAAFSSIALPDAVDLNGILAPESDWMEIPAPGAVLLGGLGVVLLGRLRRRRSL